MRLSATTFRLHRWLGWIVGLQVLLWVAGGLLFAWLPFEGWVRAGDDVRPPAAVLAPGWAEAAAPALRAATADTPVTAIPAVATPNGPALRLSRDGGPPLYVAASGGAWQAPDAAAVRRFAAALHRGGAPVASVQRLAEVPRRLLMVDEVGGRRDLWQVSFDDTLKTRIYLDGASGSFVAARNEAWVWYDFFWRLHIMDYGGGEDFNGLLLRACALLAAGLVLAGAVLALLALRRAWRRRPARAA